MDFVSNGTTFSSTIRKNWKLLSPIIQIWCGLNARIKEIDAQIKQEVATTTESLKAAYENSLALENKMKQRVEDLKHDVLDLQKRSIQYNILKREVDTNRELYTSLLQRYKEVDIASGVGATNVFVVDQADLPSSPSSPNLALPHVRVAPRIGSWSRCRVYS